MQCADDFAGPLDHHVGGVVGQLFPGPPAGVMVVVEIVPSEQVQIPSPSSKLGFEHFHVSLGGAGVVSGVEFTGVGITLISGGGTVGHGLPGPPGWVITVVMVPMVQWQKPSPSSGLGFEQYHFGRVKDIGSVVD
jgi:hypothetical protein